MRTSRTLTALALAGAVIVTGACSTSPYYAQRPMYRPVPGTSVGLLGAYLAGDIIDGRTSRRAKVVRAKIAPLSGPEVGAYMARQEADLRRQTVGTGVEVIRSGGDIVLRMPSSITFPVGSFVIQPQFQSTLREVAQTLDGYSQTYVDVLGHTDSTGSEPLNQTLSVNRAQAVSNYLKSRGVVSARLAVRGYGESAPIASNDTDEGRAQNRRVEIRIVPVAQGPGY